MFEEGLCVFMFPGGGDWGGKRRREENGKRGKWGRRKMERECKGWLEKNEEHREYRSNRLGKWDER